MEVRFALSNEDLNIMSVPKFLVDAHELLGYCLQ